MNFENKTHFEKRVANRSCARFISCCEKIEVTLIDTSKDALLTGDTTRLSAPSGALQLLGGEVAWGNFTFIALL